jgi:hypothetical protein
MRHARAIIVLALIGLVLTACFGQASDASPSASPSGSASDRPSATPAASNDGSGEPSGEPIPSDELGPFTCDLPIHIDQTVARANITDVRIGTHDVYDRVVFEFRDGFPEGSLERIDPPFTHDATGAPIDVEGTSFMRLMMRGGTKQQEDGTSSYDGPIEFDPGFVALVDLVEGGDFEAQSTWYFGLAAESCVRVLTLTDDGTARLVIDIEH